MAELDRNDISKQVLAREGMWNMSEQKDNKAKAVEKTTNLTNRSKMILEASIDGFCLLGLDGRILTANTSLCNITGYSKEELLRMKITDLEAFETAEQTAQHIDKVIKQGYHRFITKQRRKDGKIIDIEVSCQYCDLDEQKFFFAFSRDITAIKLSMDKLQQSENRYKTIFQNAVEGIIIVDAGTKKFQYVNPAICKLLGYSQKELEQMSVPDIHPRDKLEYVFSAFEAQAKGIKSLATDIPCLRKDGTVIYVNTNASKILIDSKEYLVGFFSDITEKKQDQANLKASEIRFRTLSEAAFEGLAIHENNRIFDINQRFVEMFGYTLEELDKLDGIELVAPDFRNTVKGYIDAGNKGPYETIGLKKDGSMFPIEVQARQMQFQGRTFRVAAVTDLSVQKQLENEREKYKEYLLKAQRHAYIGSMGAIVAHQVNQPLTKINILLDRALDNTGDGSCCPAVVRDIREGLAEAHKAADIIRKFRQYSKGSTFEGTGKVNINIVANRIASVLSEKAASAKMLISTKVLEDLPLVEINETAFEQIFLIIIQNAIEATDGKNKYKLDITGKFADGNIELRFADDCCGIAPENLDRIFEPFFSTKTEDRGMGLGLDIVQQILISCGGQIRVESQPGKGTTFYVTLPVSNTLEGINNEG